jgi:chemotaxis protein methyltransferase CheR
MAMEVEISEEEMNSITQSILIRYGIDFTCYEPKSLRRRIVRVMNIFSMQSVHELWVTFLRDPGFVQIFMNEISVGMTSMFRDPVLWRNLKQRIQEEHRENNSFAVWHAGCSTGEEVFSLGIVLKELQMAAKTKALATDFNANAIEEAQKGVYHQVKMTENSNNYRVFNPKNDLSSYYKAEGEYCTMDPQLISHATFQYQNLITDSYPTGFDLIFCRNVMIYFDNVAKARLLDKFHAALKPQGYFIIGFFDTMSHLIDNSKFKVVDEQAKIFQKR